MTRLEHAYGFVEFTAAAEELTRWVDDRAWTTGDGPTALFGGAVVWLREHRVLLPGSARFRTPTPRDERSWIMFRVSPPFGRRPGEHVSRTR